MPDLQRFVEAQEHSFFRALKEIRNGRKQSHWMWYVFPQIQGLGHSPAALRYAIQDIQEAKDYLHDAILGPRLGEICGAALEVECSDPGIVFGYPDDLKLRSSMTLFAAADPGNGLYGKVLEKYFNGERDQKTLDILASQERKEMDS